MKLTKVLALDNGHEPFQDWIESLDFNTQARIHSYIDRVAAGGGKKNIKNLGDGVFEIKIDFGPGFRVYFGEDGKTIILLLIGGNKRTQTSDIKTAKSYWRTYVSK